VSPALLRSQITCFPQALDENKMSEAAQFLVGEHDLMLIAGQIVRPRPAGGGWITVFEREERISCA